VFSADNTCLGIINYKHEEPGDHFPDVRKTIPMPKNAEEEHALSFRQTFVISAKRQAERGGIK